MARPITNTKSLPGIDQLTARHIDNLGILWHYLTPGPVPERDKRLQVRDIGAVAPEMEVAQYSTAYQRGDVLPAITVTVDGYVVDGNTRAEAARRAELDGLPQFVLQVHYATAPEVQIKALKVLAAGLNQVNGRRMPLDTVRNIIAEVIEPGDAPGALAAKLNCSVSTVRNVLNTKKAQIRAVEAGFSVDTLPLKHWTILGNKEAKLEQDVFLAVAQLAADANLTAAELGQLCRSTERIYAVKDKLAFVDEERAANRDRIRGITSRPTRSARARMAIGQVLKLDPDTAVELDPKLRGRHLRNLKAAEGIIQKMIAAHEALDGTGAVLPKFSGRK